MNAKKQIRRILLLSISLKRCVNLLTRGGSTYFIDIVDTDYINSLCNIEEGVGYLDDQRLNNIINDLYRHKRKGKIIYIIVTAVCHLANRYG